LGIHIAESAVVVCGRILSIFRALLQQHEDTRCKKRSQPSYIRGGFIHSKFRFKILHDISPRLHPLGKFAKKGKFRRKGLQKFEPCILRSNMGGFVGHRFDSYAVYNEDVQPELEPHVGEDPSLSK